MKHASVTFRPSRDVQELLKRIDEQRGLNRSALINAALEQSLRAVVDEVAAGIRQAGKDRN